MNSHSYRRVSFRKVSLLGLGLVGGANLFAAPIVRGAEFQSGIAARPLADGTDKKPEEPKGDPVAVEKLPKAVVNAVKKALPGVRIVKAYILKDGNYFLDDVKVGKKEWDVTVTPHGEILKKEEMKDSD